MERWVDKVIAIIVTFILPFFFTMLPYAVHGYIASKGETGRRVITYLMCFGGGIFFGTYLLHMAPEARGILDRLLWVPQGIKYPVTDLIIGAGLFFVLLLEKIIMRINKRKTQRKQKKLEQNCLVYQEQMKCYEKCQELNPGMAKSDMKKPKVCHCCKKHQPCSGLVQINGIVPTNGAAVVIICDDLNNNNNTEKHDVTALALKSAENHGVTAVAVKNIDTEITEFRGCCAEDIGDGLDKGAYSVSHDIKKDNYDAESISSDSSCSSEDSHAHAEQGHHEMRSLILVLALSLHHLFEGLSIGLQPTVTLLWTLVFAVMCHECIISFSVGLSFTRIHFSLKKHTLTAFLSCLILPLGEAIGTIMSEVGSESTALDIASGFLQAFSAGTFLFVTFFEIFQEEIDPHDTSIGKITAAFAGYIVMALLMMIPEGSPTTTTATTEYSTSADYVTEAITSLMTSVL